MITTIVIIFLMILTLWSGLDYYLTINHPEFSNEFIYHENSFQQIFVEYLVIEGRKGNFLLFQSIYVQVLI